MNPNDVLIGVLVDDAQLNLEDMARACAVEPDWLLVRLDAGLMTCCGGIGADRRFASKELQRARRMLAVERDFDANQELAALVADLLEELQSLRAELRMLAGK